MLTSSWSFRSNVETPKEHGIWLLFIIKYFIWKIKIQHLLPIILNGTMYSFSGLILSIVNSFTFHLCSWKWEFQDFRMALCEKQNPGYLLCGPKCVKNTSKNSVVAKLENSQSVWVGRVKLWIRKHCFELWHNHRKK